MNKKNREGRCSLCGSIGKLTFEHVPPKTAFNDNPIYFQDYDRMFNERSFLYGKKIRLNQGFGSYTLCPSCNNNTGNWYAKDFAEFARFGMRDIHVSKLLGLNKFVTGRHHIAPLNILKQILTMFMSADKSGCLLNDKELTRFILDKDSQDFPKKYNVYVYSTLSSIKRLMGYSIVYDPNLGICKWSEINFQPYGYVLTEDSNPPDSDMYSIRYFSNFKYDYKIDILMKTPFLNVNNPMIGVYN